MGNLEFLGKLAVDTKYCLLFVDPFRSKVYVYPMKSRKSIAAKMESFYREVEEKRKGQKTRLQTDQEFKQNKIFDLNKKYSVDMFSTAFRDGKAFDAKQKLRELKKRIFRLNALEKKFKGKRLRSYEIIKQSVENINSMPSAKYKQVPNEVDKNTIGSEANRERFNFARLEKIKREKSRLEKLDKKTYKRKKLNLRSPLEVGGEVLFSHRESEKKTILEGFTKEAWTTNVTFIIKRHFQLETDKKLKKNFFTG